MVTAVTVTIKSQKKSAPLVGDADSDCIVTWISQQRV